MATDPIVFDSIRGCLRIKIGTRGDPGIQAAWFPRMSQCCRLRGDGAAAGRLAQYEQLALAQYQKQVGNMQGLKRCAPTSHCEYLRNVDKAELNLSRWIGILLLNGMRIERDKRRALYWRGVLDSAKAWAKGDRNSAAQPVSSSSSRRAARAGVSPASIFPHGSSVETTPAPCRYCLMSSILSPSHNLHSILGLLDLVRINRDPVYGLTAVRSESQPRVTDQILRSDDFPRRNGHIALNHTFYIVWFVSARRLRSC